MAMYLQVGLEGIGVDHFVESLGGFEVLHFNYLYVGLPGLDARPYLEGTNLLGVALSALMSFCAGKNEHGLPRNHCVQYWNRMRTTAKISAV